MSKKPPPSQPPRSGGSSFRWKCPHCARPHLSRVPPGAAVGDHVRIRCPVTGRQVEALIEATIPSGGESAPGRSRFGEIRRWLKSLRHRSR
ncbi:MAG TPA: hypothetical protein VF376_12900 [Thermoanaerobaculia bacterium]